MDIDKERLKELLNSELVGDKEYKYYDTFEELEEAAGKCTSLARFFAPTLGDEARENITISLLCLPPFAIKDLERLMNREELGRKIEKSREWISYALNTMVGPELFALADVAETLCNQINERQQEAEDWLDSKLDRKKVALKSLPTELEEE